MVRIRVGNACVYEIFGVFALPETCSKLKLVIYEREKQHRLKYDKIGWICSKFGWYLF